MTDLEKFKSIINNQKESSKIKAQVRVLAAG